MLKIMISRAVTASFCQVQLDLLRPPADCAAGRGGRYTVSDRRRSGPGQQFLTVGSIMIAGRPPAAAATLA